MKLIEMVCTGNQGRSPIAELVGKNYLGEINALAEYNTISSGTAVHGIRSGKLNVSFMLSVIEIGKNRGDIYNASELQLVDYAIGKGDKEAIKDFYNKAANKFVEEERKDRLDILLKYGISGKIKEMQEQTVARENTIAVFSMAKRNNEQVKNIYVDSRYNPKIDVLSAYATGNLDLEIPNAFGLGRKAYEETVEAILEHVPKAIEKVLK